MFNSKYSKMLTAILILVIVGIIGTIGYFVYDIYTIRAKNNKAQEVVDQFSNTSVKKEFDSKDNDESTNSTIQENPIENVPSIETSAPSVEPEKVYMEGYEVMGIIEIPKTGIKYPVLSNVTTKSLETSVAILYPEGCALNQPGNVTIAGHNYKRSGVFFSDNKKLSKGDVIYLTDQMGNKVTYEIYDVFQAKASYADYMIRDTEGAREISLSTCTDNDPNTRIVVLAKEK